MSRGYEMRPPLCFLRNASCMADGIQEGRLLKVWSSPVRHWNAIYFMVNIGLCYCARQNSFKNRTAGVRSKNALLNVRSKNALLNSAHSPSDNGNAYGSFLSTVTFTFTFLEPTYVRLEYLIIESMDSLFHGRLRAWKGTQLSNTQNITANLQIPKANQDCQVWSWLIVSSLPRKWEYSCKTKSKCAFKGWVLTMGLLQKFCWGKNMSFFCQ